MAGQADRLWNDPALAEQIDRGSPWRAGCRWLQSRWREEHLALPCGPRDPRTPDRVVASQLPLDAPRHSNFLSEQAFASAEDRLGRTGEGGLISEDRLIRNLLSSQPLCFNLFGHLRHYPDALLAWLRRLGFDARGLRDVRLEWAPPRRQHFGGGSAFDTLIVYETATGNLAALGVECKYAEDLSEQNIRPRRAYIDYTIGSGHWRSGATERLCRAETVQLWLNTLLAQSCVDRPVGGWSDVAVVMLTCGTDRSAFAATRDVGMELVEPSRWLRWSSYESLVDLAARHDELVTWADDFRARYLDFGPVAELLAPDDPRRDRGAGSVVADLIAVLTAATAAAPLEPVQPTLPTAGCEATDAQLVADHCLAVLGPIQQWRGADGYRSLALCVLDSIYSVGIRYERVVRPLVKRYRDHRRAEGADAEHDTLTDLLWTIERTGGPDAFATDVLRNQNRTSSRSGILKSEAVYRAAGALHQHGVDTIDQLLASSGDTRVGLERAWRSVIGQRSGITWRYLLILAGEDELKADRMIRRFCATALGFGPDERAVSADRATELIRDAVIILRRARGDLTLRILDQVVWRYQSGQSGRRPR